MDTCPPYPAASRHGRFGGRLLARGPLVDDQCCTLSSPSFVSVAATDAALCSRMEAWRNLASGMTPPARPHRWCGDESHLAGNEEHYHK